MKSNTSSYVYYDDPSIQSGLYERDKFMFAIEPFSMDSLDKFSNDDINLKGLFKSEEYF